MTQQIRETARYEGEGHALREKAKNKYQLILFFGPVTKGTF
jgi:hypothetical protein